MERQIKAGVFRKLDRAKLSNWSNLDPEVLQRVALHDPGNEHAVNHMWGTDGIGYNEGKIKAIDPNAPVDSWQIVLDPKWAAKFKDCGISVLDAPSEMVGVALAYLGKDPNSQSEADLKAAEEPAAQDPPVHPHDPQLQLHRRTRERRVVPGCRAGAATSCRRVTVRPKPARAT